MINYLRESLKAKDIQNERLNKEDLERELNKIEEQLRGKTVNKQLMTCIQWH
jgi:hypothetical protein